MTAAIRVTGTDDPVEIAAVVAALTRRTQPVQVTGYERWRRSRVGALRASRAS